jgi:hypothetical protein
MQTHENRSPGKAKGIATLVMSSLILGACMSPMNKTHRYEDGWRHVEFVGPSPGGRGNAHVASDCSRDAGLALEAGTRFFVLVKENQRIRIVDEERISFPKWRYETRYRIVTVDAAQDLKPGDTLLANLADCRVPATLLVKP